MHLNRSKTRKIRCNTLRYFPLQGFNKHLPWFRCGQGRIRQPTRSQQTRCKIFSNYARGSDPRQGWNAAECKCTLEALLAGVFTKRAAEQHMHLNRNETRKIRCNSLRNFPLQGFNKHLPWFRCSGKGEHLNLTARQNPAANSLTTNALQDFSNYTRGSDPWRAWNTAERKCALEVFLAGVSTKRATEQHMHLNLATRQNPAVNPLTANVLQEFLRLRPWFRSQPGLEHHRTQIRLGALLRGIP